MDYNGRYLEYSMLLAYSSIRNPVWIAPNNWIGPKMIKTPNHFIDVLNLPTRIWDVLINDRNALDGVPFCFMYEGYTALLKSYHHMPTPLLTCGFQE